MSISKPSVQQSKPSTPVLCDGQEVATETADMEPVVTPIISRNCRPIKELKPGCGVSCKRKVKCTDLFSYDERKNIYTEYHSKDYAGKKAFILDKVHKTNIQRRRKRKVENSRKKQSYEYH